MDLARQFMDLFFIFMATAKRKVCVFAMSACLVSLHLGPHLPVHDKANHRKEKCDLRYFEHDMVVGASWAALSILENC